MNGKCSVRLEIKGLHENREPRRTVGLSGFILLDENTIIPVEVVDLSYDGCSIQTPVALVPDTKLKLSIPKLGALDAYVRWHKDCRAGLCFRPEASRKTQTPRAQKRLELNTEVSVRQAGRPHFRTRVLDFSLAGCKLEFVERPRVGEVVWMKFNSLVSLEATVRWVDGFYGGIEFKRAIHPAVFEMLAARLVGEQKVLCRPANLPAT